MKKSVRILGYIIVAVLMCMGVTGCEQKGKSVEVKVPDAEAIIQTLPKKDKPAANQNLLTGLDDLSQEAIGKRPVAVMVNNVRDALPQYGVGQADVIFELPVEGNITRLMAVYADYTKVPDVCAIRSCRYYYPAIAQGFDAFYIHWGSDNSILGYVNSLGIDRYDGMGNPHGLFGRDAARRNAGYALEHTGYFKGTKFAAAVESEGTRTDLKESKTGTAFQFCGISDRIVPAGQDCNGLKINFGATTAGFHYDADTLTYQKKAYGQNHIDGKTGETLSFTNVFVLETSISIRDAVGHKKIDWAGSSNAKGYYISNGKMEKIHWSKANNDEDEYLKFYKESGEELVINRGKTYIAYTGPNTVAFE